MLATTQPGTYAQKNIALAEMGFLIEGHLSPDGNHLSVPKPVQDPAIAGESLTQQLLGAAFSQYASGMPGHDHDGVTGAGMANTLNGGFYRAGQFNSFDRMYVPDAQQEADPQVRAQARDAAAQVLREQGARGEETFANVNGHWVMAKPVDGDMVQMVDLSGQRHTVPMSQFLDELNSLVFDKGGSQPPAWTQNDAWGKPGIGTGYKPGTSGGQN